MSCAVGSAPLQPGCSEPPPLPSPCSVTAGGAELRMTLALTHSWVSHPLATVHPHSGTVSLPAEGPL